MPKLAYAGLLLLLGAVGGLITAFYSLGEALPGIGGNGLIEPQVARMQAFENASTTCAARLAEIQDKLKSSTSQDPSVENMRYLAAQYVEEMKLYEKHVARLRDLVNNNQWRIWAYGLPMYVIIGSATSLLLARDWLQALLFGYSWAGVVSSIGLKGTVAQKNTNISQQGQQMIEEIQRLTQEKRALENKTDLAQQVLALAVQQIHPTS